MKERIEIQKADRSMFFTGEVSELANGDLGIRTIADEDLVFRREQILQRTLLDNEAFMKIKNEFDRKVSTRK